MRIIPSDFSTIATLRWNAIAYTEEVIAQYLSIEQNVYLNKEQQLLLVHICE
jgi:hypothetical protein